MTTHAKDVWVWLRQQQERGDSKTDHGSDSRWTALAVTAAIVEPFPATITARGTADAVIAQLAWSTPATRPDMPAKLVATAYRLACVKEPSGYPHRFLAAGSSALSTPMPQLGRLTRIALHPRTVADTVAYRTTEAAVDGSED